MPVMPTLLWPGPLLPPGYSCQSMVEYLTQLDECVGKSSSLDALSQMVNNKSETIMNNNIISPQ